MTRRALCALLLAALVSCAPAPHLARSPEVYVNPVLDRDFPDPAVLRGADGWIYAYATRTPEGSRMLNLQVARTRDLVRWQHLGDALPEKPSWASGRIFWAPHVLYDAQRRKYFMYYSAQPASGRGHCLAVATAERPQGPFTDAGTPLLCGSGFENIDPMAFDDPRSGRPLLYWGSGFQPLRVQELAPDRMGFLPGSAPREVIFPDKAKRYRALVEGAWVVFRDGRYYLFYSGDYCCGPKARYAIMVARADSPFGPFEDYASGAPIIEASEAWLAPGHNSVFRDDAGDDWLLYHAYRPGRPEARVMLVDRIVYRDGWPRVAGDRPSSSAQPGPRWRLEPPVN